MPAFVPAAARAVALFEVFAREKRPLLNSELARLLDLRESSCSDLVNTLVGAGFLMRTAATWRIYPTARLLSVGKRVSEHDIVFTAISEGCELLRNRTSESVLAGRVENGYVRVIASCEGSHPLRYSSVPGDKLSLHVSALGKAILALGPADEAARQLRIKPVKRIASNTTTDLSLIERQIADIKLAGWAKVENEGGEDLAAIAMAGHFSGEPIAIALAGPVGRLRSKNDEYLSALRAVAHLVFDNPGESKTD